MAATAVSQPQAPIAGATPRASRVANVDVLRAIAALAVLLVHAYALGGRAAPFRAQHWYDVPLINLASGVWLFFGISGYVITRPFVDRLVSGRPLPPTLPYALRRAFRIFPLYLVALTAVIAIDGTAGTSPWQLPFHYLLLHNLIPGQEQALLPPAWTLTLELLFYVSVPVLAALVSRRRSAVSPERLAALVLASWAASVAFTVVADLQGDSQMGLWLRGLLPAMWQMFCPGILLAIVPHLSAPRWRRLVDFRWRGALIALAAVAFAAAAMLYADAPLRFGIPTYQLLVDASRPLFAIAYGIVIAAAISSRPWGGPAWWGFRLGLISYGIYLIHPVLEELLLRNHVSPVGRDTLIAFLVNGLCLGVATTAVALASWKWFEQPAIQLGRRLGGAWRARQERAPMIRRTGEADL